MQREFRLGDLVRYVRRDGEPPFVHIIPRDKSPIGIVTEVRDYLVGEDEYQARMIVVYVRWADCSWNTCSGVSEESPCDLELIQKPTQEEAKET
jgi:hypothetical protein